MITDLRPGYKFNQYQLLEQIGAGGQGVVWSAEDLSRQIVVAIKFNEVLEESQEEVDDAILQEELKELIKLHHGHVLQIHDYGMFDQVRYLISPYIAGGSLYEAIGKQAMQPVDALRYAAEIASALDFLHGNRIIHRDLKPANVLLDLQKHTYLSDFGLARTISNTTQAMHTGRGTPPYAPPEQHKQLAITARSDLYSFGVMLYEMFTGQLPWNGEKILGMQQLYTPIEMPDPCEVIPQLPPGLRDILRKLTSSDPALRPSSAGEVINWIQYAFQLRGSPEVQVHDEFMYEQASSQDAQMLLEEKLADWNTKSKQTWLTPTRFALVHLEKKRSLVKSIAGPEAQFLLYHSMVYGYHHEYWWPKISDARDRASVSLALLERRNDVVAQRVLNHLFQDRDALSFFRAKAASLSTFLLDLAFQSRTPPLSVQLFSLVQLIVPPPLEWNDLTIPAAQGSSLGKAALQENDLGTRALELIAHARSRSAIEFITKNAGRRLPFILSKIQSISGSLPPLVRFDIRLRMFLEWATQQLSLQPSRLAGGYGMALLGSTVGIALQIYLTYRLPDYLDLTRISSSLIQGLITGFVFSIGIFLSRLLTERFEGISFLLRFCLAAILGTAGTSAAIFLFHILFLNTMPSGFLIPLGCFLIACSYSLGRLVPWRMLKMLISSMAVFTAILGTWWVHRLFSASVTDLTPIFQYDYQWPTLQVGLVALCMAASIGIVGNLSELDVQEH